MPVVAEHADEYIRKSALGLEGGKGGTSHQRNSMYHPPSIDMVKSSSPHGRDC